MENQATSDPLNDLLLDLFRAPRDVAPARLRDLSAADWAGIVRRAGEHRCLPYLAYALEQAGYAAAPAAAREARKAWTFRFLTISRECDLLHHILVRNNIPHLFLKGVPLALGTYPWPWMRPVRDIDILVRPEDQARAYSLLRNRSGPIERHAHRGPDMAPEAKHCTPVWSPSKAIPVELHDKIVSGMGGISGDAVVAFTARAWTSPGHFAAGERSLPCPNPSVMFLHLVFHAVYDHELNNGPLFVTDLIHLLRSAPMDVETVTRIGAEFGILPGIALALSLLPADLPQRAALSAAIGQPGQLPRATAAALLLQDMRLATETKLAADLVQAPPRDRARLLLRKVFASRETMIDRWHMAGRSGPPPATALPLWLWFLKDRATAMRRLHDVQPETASHQHLLELRRLRDGNRA